MSILVYNYIHCLIIYLSQIINTVKFLKFNIDTVVFGKNAMKEIWFLLLLVKVSHFSLFELWYFSNSLLLSLYLINCPVEAWLIDMDYEAQINLIKNLWESIIMINKSFICKMLSYFINDI